ncbi:L10-interacting MYB domain-containing protein-like [Phalaenopsis equestris]|uniref:L10-interacting MYB domain-containing protein-like n=1 Tax=Phalaenopsis equestris TaxID=78828 RepID=UPI0009E1CC0C|nr:L10-interacting MYB domain-containing protein-like [Phalaenopsis equestris]
MTNKNKKVATPALWEKDTKLILCDICICEIDKGNRPTTFFNKEVWDNIVSKFKEMTGREYDRLQLKTKWDQLKKDWKLWSDLKCGSTVLGWDPIVPAAKKFRLAGIEPELEDKLQMMFGGVVATGKFSAAPTETVFETTLENVAVELSNDSAEFRSVEPPEIQSINRAKCPRNENKRKSGPASMREQLSYLVDSSNDAPHIVQKTLVHEVIELLEEESEFTGERDLFYFVVDLFCDSLHRDFFTALSKE